MRKIIFAILGVAFSSGLAYGENFSVYEGKIKSIYMHMRDANPYFGIEVDGVMDKNPCGASLNYFIISPDKLDDRLLSILLAAKTAGMDVQIINGDSSVADRCHGAYPTFNYVKLK